MAVLAVAFCAVAPDTAIGTEPPRAASVTDLTPTPDLDERLARATDLAQARGAEVSIAVLDRVTGVRVSNGDTTPMETASVSKLFIADDVLFREFEGDITLSTRDRARIDTMLRSSDDSAAEDLWTRFGSTEMVDRITSRYQLLSTSVAPGAAWWRTQTTMSDVVAYYSGLLDGSGGLPADRAAVVLRDIRHFTDTGSDGYYQRFGLPDALPHEPEIAVKQGWMCCIDGDWIHLSTGLAGDDHRYIVAMGARESTARYGDGETGAEHARRTLTDATALLFPEGRIEL